MSRNLWLISGLIILALAAAGFVYWWNRPEPIKTTEEAIEVLTESPVSSIVPGNPLENKVPEVNPVDKANPFKDAYKNPFSP